VEFNPDAVIDTSQVLDKRVGRPMCEILINHVPRAAGKVLEVAVWAVDHQVPTLIGILGKGLVVIGASWMLLGMIQLSVFVCRRGSA